MKRLSWGFVLFVAACGTAVPQYPAGWQQLKAACVGGDFAACSEIGHQARAAQAPDPRIPPRRVVISEPIVD